MAIFFQPPFAAQNYAPPPTGAAQCKGVYEMKPLAPVAPVARQLKNSAAVLQRRKTRKPSSATNSPKPGSPKGRKLTEATNLQRKPRKRSPVKPFGPVKPGEKLERVPCPFRGCTSTPVNTRYEFGRHIDTHIPPKDRLYQCEFDGCGAAHTQKSNHNNHLKIHKKARLICNKEYLQDGEVRYCGFCCTSRPIMNQHRDGLQWGRHYEEKKALEEAMLSEDTLTQSSSESSEEATPAPVATPTPVSTPEPVHTTSPLVRSPAIVTSPEPVALSAHAVVRVPLPFTPRPMVDPRVSSASFFPGYRGGITGAFSLHPRDFKAFLYDNHC